MTPFTCPTCGAAHRLAEIVLTDSAVFFRGENLHFTPAEFRLFAFLYTTPRARRLTEIYDHLYLPSADYGEIEPGGIAVLICRIRKRLQPTPLTIPRSFNHSYILTHKESFNDNARPRDHRSARA